MPELTLVPDAESIIDIASHTPTKLVIRLSPATEPPPTGEEVQVVRNSNFQGPGDWRRGDPVDILEWDNLYAFPYQATKGNGKGRPVKPTDPTGSGRFKAAEHEPLELDDGPIPYGGTATIRQTITLPKSVTQGRLTYRQVAHFDEWDKAGFTIVVNQVDGDVRFNAFTLPGFEYVPDESPLVQQWQKFEHVFPINPEATGIEILISATMPPSGRTGTKISEFELWAS